MNLRQTNLERFGVRQTPRPTLVSTTNTEAQRTNRDKSPREKGRDDRSLLGLGALEAIRTGSYTTPDGTQHSIRDATALMKQNTRFYKKDSATLVNWLKRPSTLRDGAAARGRTVFQVVEQSTIASARSYLPRTDVGVLNFASAKRPGGGFLSGAQAQEESIARSSNLYASLTTDTAAHFYKMHIGDKSEDKAAYSHAMIFSPGVVLMRNEEEEWAEPYPVAVVTSAAVNAGEFRKRKTYERGDEDIIEQMMRERMGRILRLFEDRGANVLVLGSFGTGVFQNSVSLVASIWADLLGPAGRFDGVFEEVKFGIIGNKTFRDFHDTFMTRLAERRSFASSGP